MIHTLRNRIKSDPARCIVNAALVSFVTLYFISLQKIHDESLIYVIMYFISGFIAVNIVIFYHQFYRMLAKAFT